jgi:hypothetical protein
VVKKEKFRSNLVKVLQSSAEIALQRRMEEPHDLKDHQTNQVLKKCKNLI